MAKKYGNNGGPRVGDGRTINSSSKVRGDNILAGSHPMVSNQGVDITPLFQTITQYVESHPKLQAGKKQDAKKQLNEIQTALEDHNPDENFIVRRLRNLKRMSPDIVDVFFDRLKNSLGGVAEVIKRVEIKVAE